MKVYVYAVKAEYNEFDDEPCGVYGIHKTRAGAEAYIVELQAEEQEHLEPGDELRGYEIEAYELKE